MAAVTSVCVYCGSSDRGLAAHHEAATRLGTTLAENGIELVYGGGRIGLMGIAADAALAAGGRVVGIIPRHLETVEVGHGGLSELIVTENMHDRKRAMFERADAFVSLPGGLGTLDETFEIVTWKQLGLHDKPVIIADIGGYWAPLRTLLEAVIDGAYAKPNVRALYQIVETVDDILPTIAAAPRPCRPAIADLI